MTKQNADNAHQAKSLAADAKQAADKGNEAMGRMTEAIDEIRRPPTRPPRSSRPSTRSPSRPTCWRSTPRSRRPGPARPGKGFAVVAEEVRNLAMRAAEAAKNTASMIEESVKNAENGVRDQPSEVGEVLEEIVEQRRARSTDLVAEIAAASQEQAQGIEQVNTAVAQMDKVTQQNAANAEESASAAEETDRPGRDHEGHRRRAGGAGRRRRQCGRENGQAARQATCNGCRDKKNEGQGERVKENIKES